jgi:hypothetical protein
MSEDAAERQSRWRRMVHRLERDYRCLPPAEKARIAELSAPLVRLQQSLDRLFSKADGARICAACRGACCAKGHNHACLPNLLAYLQQQQAPPQPDFSQTCPWLGPRGCVHEAGRRPYNCISFLCDKLEERLAAADVAEFYRLDRALRTCYQAFVARYPGGGMTGLLLQSARLDGRSLLFFHSATTDDRAQEPV